MKQRRLLTLCSLILASALLSNVLGQDHAVGNTTSEETLSKSYGGKVYSPYAERYFPTFPLWGDSHLHTGYSMDAALFGNRTLHETAYRLPEGRKLSHLQDRLSSFPVHLTGWS